MSRHRRPPARAWPYLLTAAVLGIVAWWPDVVAGDPPVPGGGAPLYVTVIVWPPCPPAVVRGVVQPCRD